MLNFRNYQVGSLIYHDGRETTNKNKEINRSNRWVNFYTNLGFNYDILQKEKTTIFIQPFFQFATLGFVKQASLKRHTMHFGMSLGVKI